MSKITGYDLRPAVVALILVSAMASSSCHHGDWESPDQGPPVWGISLRHDAKVLASSGEDGSIAIWDVASGKRIATLSADKEVATALAFSPVEKTLASVAGAGGTITLWEGDAFKMQARFTVDPALLCSLAYSPDGKVLAVGLGNKFAADGASVAVQGNNIRLLDSATGKCIRSLDGSRGDVCSVAFSPDGCMLVSGGFDDKVRLWDVASGRNTAVLDGNIWIASVAFSPDGRTVASGDATGTITFWDVRTARKIEAIKAHSKRTVRCLAFAANKLASGGDDHYIRIWDSTTRKEVLKIHAHSQSVWSLSFASDGKTLASGSCDGTAKVWDATSGTPIAVFHHYEAASQTRRHEKADVSD